MYEVYNPYYFVPFAAPDKAQHIEANKKAIKTAQKSHDAYYNLSGELQLTLTTQSATIIGNQQKSINDQDPNLPVALLGDNQKAKYLQPYLRDGKPAIPGNSLRGMVSSIAEIISNSAPRVLQDENYFVREKTGTFSYAVGVLQHGENKNELWLQPLGLPFEKWNNPNNTHYKLSEKWQNVFRTHDGKALPLSDIMGMRLPERCNVESSVLASKHIAEPLNWQQDTLTSVSTSPLTEIASLSSDSALPKELQCIQNITINNRPQKRLLCRSTLNNDPTSTDAAYCVIRATAKSKLAFRGNENGEFLAAKIKLDNDTVITPYLSLKNNATQQQSGQSKTILNNADLAGQIVLFEINEDKHITLRDSVMWRQQLADTTYDFLAPEQLPFNAARNTLSPSEQLFGVISTDNSTERQHLSAYASRIRFYDAISEQCSDTSAITYAKLPLMGSPKTPSPSMYFSFRRENKHNHINKVALNARQHQLNGAKRYLRQNRPEQHLSSLDDNRQDAQDINRLRVPTIAPTQQYSATIAFTNLSQSELALLIMAVCPLGNYVHQIGLGKNLGLGQIKVTQPNVFITNRDKRYSAYGLQSERNTQIADNEIGTLLGGRFELIDVESLTKLMSLNSIEWAQTHPIAYPTVIRNNETTIYQWFMNNDKLRFDDKKRQTLETDDQGKPKSLRIKTS